MLRTTHDVYGLTIRVSANARVEPGVPRSRIRLKAATTFSGSSQPPSCRHSFRLSAFQITEHQVKLQVTLPTPPVSLCLL